MKSETKVNNLFTKKHILTQIIYLLYCINQVFRFQINTRHLISGFHFHFHLSHYSRMKITLCLLAVLFGVISAEKGQRGYSPRHNLKHYGSVEGRGLWLECGWSGDCNSYHRGAGGGGIGGGVGYGGYRGYGGIGGGLGYGGYRNVGYGGYGNIGYGGYGNIGYGGYGNVGYRGYGIGSGYGGYGIGSGYGGNVGYGSYGGGSGYGYKKY